MGLFQDSFILLSRLGSQPLTVPWPRIQASPKFDSSVPAQGHEQKPSEPLLLILLLLLCEFLGEDQLSPELGRQEMFKMLLTQQGDGSTDLHGYGIYSLYHVTSVS